MSLFQVHLSKPKRKQPKPLIALFVGLALLAGLEILLRVSWVPPKLPQHELFTEHDPVYGWRKIPGLQRVYQGDEYSSLESFNSKGIRGPEYPYEKPNQEYRILILGDSHSEGYSVEFQNLFSEILKKQLNALGDRSYQVINAGTRAYTTDQELLFFQKEGNLYNPDLTLLLFSAPNVWQNLQPTMDGRTKPFFKLEGGRLELRGVPVPHSKSSLGFGGFLKRQCTLCGFVTHQIKQISFFSWIVKFRLVTPPDHLRTWKKNSDKIDRQAWELTEALLVQLQQVTRKAGSSLLVGYVPGADQVEEKVWLATRKKYALIGQEWDPLQVSRELAAICVKNKIPFLDLTPPFRLSTDRLQGGRKDLYFLSDGHWTEDGHRLAAGILNEYISREY